MARPGHYLAVYDISDDKERLRTSKILEGFGFRIQESVFECLLTRAGKQSLLRQLGQSPPQSGFVILYRLTTDTEPVSIGARQRPALDQGLAYVI